MEANQITEVHIEWVNAPTSYATQQWAERVCRARGDFGKPTPEERAHIQEALLASAWNDIDIHQIMNLRSQINTQKAIENQRHLKREARLVQNMLREGCPCDEIATFYDVPPLNVTRLVMEVEGVSKKQIASIMKDPSRLADDQLREQVEIARACSITPQEQVKQLRKATKFEEHLATFLTQHGARFKTQEELLEEQIGSSQVMTPDFLFTNEVYINGLRCYWIDAKNFFGAANLRALTEKLGTQAEKYCKRYGPGALIFKLGFCDKLHIKDTICLDARSIEKPLRTPNAFQTCKPV